MGNSYQNTNLVLLEDNDYNWTCNHTFEELFSISKEDFLKTLKLFDDEVWKSCSSIDLSNYWVSNYGRIKRVQHYITKNNGKGKTYKTLISSRIIYGHLAEDEYYYISLTNDDNLTITTQIHRLVAFMFCSDGRPEEFEYNPKSKKVDHIDRNKKDNRAINLRWATNSENGKNSKRRATRYNYKDALYDHNASEEDLIESVEPNVDIRWFTLTSFKGEVWKLVKGYEEYRTYISNYGRVKKPVNNSKELYISHFDERKGYFIVYLPQRKFEDSQKSFRVHRLVAQAFLDFDIDAVDENGIKLTVDHKNRNKHNNIVSEIKPGTQYDNMQNEKTRELFKRKRNSSQVSILVNVYNYPEGNFIHQAESIYDAEEYLGAKHSTISKCCKGKTAIIYSPIYNRHFITRFCSFENSFDRTNLWNSDIFNIYDLYKDDTILFTKNNRERLFNVYEYPSGDFVKRFDNFQDAVDELHLTIDSISKAIVGTTLLTFSKEDKKYYAIRRINFENLDNYSNLFESGMMNIENKIITKNDLEKSYNPYYEKYINLYAYPSGRFISKFNYVDDVVQYFNGRKKNFNIYSYLNESNCFKDDKFESYFTLRYVENIDNTESINLANVYNLDIMISQTSDSGSREIYQNIFDVCSKHPEFDIDSLFYHIQTDKKVYGYIWSFTRKHMQDIDIDITKLSKTRNIISVNKYNLEGKFIDHYNDIYDITSDEIKIYNIRKCVNEKQQSAYGFVWRDANKYQMGIDLNIDKPIKTQNLCFSAYDENDNLIEKFTSTKIAAEKYGIVVRKIYRMLNKEVYINYNNIKIKFKKDEYNSL